MSITLNLRENGHVFHLVFVDPWQTEELVRVYAEEQRLLDQSPFKIHSLADVRLSRGLAKGALQTARHRGLIEHPMRGTVAVLGASSFLRNLTEMIFRNTRFNRLRFFADETAAWDHLREIIHAEGLTEVK
jgi:hypothetical protein